MILSQVRLFIILVITVIVFLGECPICQSTFVVTRGVDDTTLAVLGTLPSNLSVAEQRCHYDEGDVITLSHPISLDSNDTYYTTCILSYQAVSMTVDYINFQRCGIHIQGKNYSILLKSYSDSSDPIIHQAIGNQIVNRTDFMLSGYPSELTQMITGIAEKNSKVLVAGGSSRRSLFVNRSYVFGTLPPSDTYLLQAFLGLAQFQPKTVAYIQDENLRICSSVPNYTAQFGLELVGATTVPSNPNETVFDAVALNMSIINPDIMITCVFAINCGQWIASMRKIGWSPKAQVFAICLGSYELESAAGAHDIAFMLGASSFDRVLPPIPDAVTGWTPSDFAIKFEQTTFQNATYQYAAAAAAVTVLVQAIERADSINSTLVMHQLANGTFQTMYGSCTFASGQNTAISWLMQYDATGENLNIVYPNNPVADIATPPIVYPMPGWDHRDCLMSGICQASGGNCTNDGTCTCTGIDGTIAFGIGALAYCKLVPDEDMNYVSDGLVNLSIAFLCIQLVISITCIIWTVYNRNRPVVKASQPLFLHFVSFGCIVLASAIVPTFYQGAYRYIQNPLTGGLTNVTNPEVDQLDAACMAFPWLAGLGFVIVFSALFAKIQRVQKLVKHAERMSRKTVKAKDVAAVMIFMITIEFAILLGWQLSSPLRWKREVLTSDEDGFPLESVGYCASDHSLAFLIPLVTFNGLCLIYALYLCWVTRNVPNDFAEGSWITLSVVSIFQIMLLAIPILVITADNTDATFFVRSTIVFLCSSTVSLLIFVPKMWKLVRPDGDNLNIRDSKYSKNSNSWRNDAGIGSSDLNFMKSNSFRSGPLPAPLMFNDQGEMSDPALGKRSSGTELTSLKELDETERKEEVTDAIAVRKTPATNNTPTINDVDMIPDGQETMEPEQEEVILFDHQRNVERTNADSNEQLLLNEPLKDFERIFNTMEHGDQNELEKSDSRLEI